MSKVCKTAKELADSIKNNEDEIIIEGDLKNAAFRIKATGKIAWAVCGASLAAAIALYITTPPAIVIETPAGGAMHFLSGTAVSTVAAATLGTAVVPAIMIGVCAGGVGALTTLRDKYKIVEKNDKYLKLKRR